MSAQHPPGNAFLGVGDLGDVHSRMHGRTLLVGENVLAYGADRTGVADSTAAFIEAENAAGAGGRIMVPPGIYVLDNWTPNEAHDDMSLVGSGWGSRLQAKTPGSFAMTMSGLWHWKVSDISFDGSAGGVSASASGLKIQGSATSGSQLHTFDHVRFRRSIKGLHVAQGTISQADKNTYIGCQWADNTTGAHIDSVNAQNQVFIQPTFDTHTTGMEISHGGVSIIGGQMQGCITDFHFTGTNIVEFSLREFISEGATVAIAGATNWPETGVILDSVILQAAGTNIEMGSTGSVLFARGCRFNTGDITTTANDTVYIDDYNTYDFGASYVANTGTNQRHHVRSLASHTVKRTTAGVDAPAFQLVDATGAVILSHAGGTIGFFGSAGSGRPAAYTVSNPAEDRSYDANATTTNELADVVATIIADLKALGLFQ